MNLHLKCTPLMNFILLLGVRMSNLLHENLCKNKRQNTITGLLKKMSEKVMQNSSPHKNNGPQCEKGKKIYLRNKSALAVNC